jgi:hypothetical protein
MHRRDAYFALAVERRLGADSGLPEAILLGPQSALLRHSPLRPPMTALDPFLPFKIEPLNGR